MRVDRWSEDEIFFLRRTPTIEFLFLFNIRPKLRLVSWKKIPTYRYKSPQNNLGSISLLAIVIVEQAAIERRRSGHSQSEEDRREEPVGGGGGPESVLREIIDHKHI